MDLVRGEPGLQLLDTKHPRTLCRTASVSSCVSWAQSFYSLDTLEGKRYEERGQAQDHSDDDDKDDDDEETLRPSPNTSTTFEREQGWKSVPADKTDVMVDTQSALVNPAVLDMALEGHPSSFSSLVQGDGSMEKINIRTTYATHTDFSAHKSTRTRQELRLTGVDEPTPTQSLNEPSTPDSDDAPTITGETCSSPAQRSTEPIRTPIKSLSQPLPRHRQPNTPGDRSRPSSDPAPASPSSPLVSPSPSVPSLTISSASHPSSRRSSSSMQHRPIVPSPTTARLQTQLRFQRRSTTEDPYVAHSRATALFAAMDARRVERERERGVASPQGVDLSERTGGGRGRDEHREQGPDTGRVDTGAAPEDSVLSPATTVTIHWNSPATRRREYAEHDERMRRKNARKGARGLVLRLLDGCKKAMVCVAGRGWPRQQRQRRWSRGEEVEEDKEEQFTDDGSDARNQRRGGKRRQRRRSVAKTKFYTGAKEDDRDSVRRYRLDVDKMEEEEDTS